MLSDPASLPLLCLSAVSSFSRVREFESLQGHYRSAFTHIISGIDVLNDDKSKRSALPVYVDLRSKSEIFSAGCPCRASE